MRTELRDLARLSAAIVAIVLAPNVNVLAAPILAPSVAAFPAACRAGGPPSFDLVGGAVRARPVVQVTRNEPADLTFEVRPSPNGALVVQATGGDFAMRKTVQQGGGWTLELQSRSDSVVINVAEHDFSVRRGQKSVSVALATATEENLFEVRRLLADSRAVALFRAASAAIEASEDDSAPSAAVLMSDSLVGALTGDVGAPRRIARHLARHVLAKTRRVGMGADCYGVWEQRVMTSWMDYMGCVMDVSPWAMLQIMCAARWSLQVESYWWTFIACSSLPF